MLLFIGVGATAEEFEPGGDMSRLVIGVGKDRVGANDRDRARCDNRKNESGGSGNSAQIVLTRRHSSTRVSPRPLTQRVPPMFLYTCGNRQTRGSEISRRSPHRSLGSINPLRGL